MAEGSPIVLWDPGTGKQRAIVKQQAENPQTAAFSPDGKLLATSFSDGFTAKIQLWRLP